MNPIPIYDATAPIVCTATPAEIPTRIETIERLRLALQAIERTSDGLLLQFPLRDDITEDVRTFTIDEKRCCQFWGFELQEAGETLTFRWDGPPDTAEFMDKLLDYFEGDQPLTIDSGLL